MSISPTLSDDIKPGMIVCCPDCKEGNFNPRYTCPKCDNRGIAVVGKDRKLSPVGKKLSLPEGKSDLMGENMMPEWKNISSYQQGEKDRIPKSFEMEVRASIRVRLGITRAHIHYPNRWVMWAYPFLDTQTPLVAAYDDIEGAKAEALELVRKLLVELVVAFQCPQPMLPR